MKNYTLFKIVIFIFSTLFLTLFLSSCRGQKSSKPPIVFMRNMMDQTTYGPQSKNEFYPDGLAKRSAPSGTVAENEAFTDLRLYQGIETTSNSDKPVWIKTFPILLTDKVLSRGQERFDIYCTPCHGYTGHSDGLVTQRSKGSIRPSNIHDKKILTLAVGQIYSAITKGVNNWNMPGFVEQMSVQDRWAVVAYVRALQYSQKASIKDLPKDIKEKNGWSENK